MRPAALALSLRPHLLPAAVLCYLAGAILGGSGLVQEKALRPLAYLALLSFAATCCRRRNASGTFLLLLSFILSGIACTGLALLPPSDPGDIYQLFPDKAKATLTGTVVAMPEYDGRTSRFVLAADSVLLPGKLPGGPAPRKARGKIRLSLEGVLPQEIQAGSRLLLTATVGRAFSSRTPGVFDYRLYLAAQGIRVTGRLDSPLALMPFTDRSEPRWRTIRFAPEVLRQQFNTFLAAKLEPKEASLYQALLLGNQVGLDDQTLEQYKATGCTHILSISGVHMALLGLLLTWSISWLLKRSTYLLLHTHVPTVAILLSLGPLVAYTAIAGMQTPALRALLMSVLFLVGVVLRRQRSILPIIAAAALVILLVSPLALFTVSFQLSFTAVVALALIYPRLLARHAQKRPETAFTAGIRYVGSGLLVSLAATLGTLPFLLYHFNRVSLIGPFVNLLVEPILCFWTLPLGLLAMPLTFIFPDAALFLLHAGGLGIAAADRITALAGSLPFASVWTVTPSPLEIILYFLLLGSWISWPVTARTLSGHLTAAGLLLALFTRGLWLPQAGPVSEVSFLDVGQGSSSFLRLPRGETILIDGGSKGAATFDLGERVLAPFLWKNGVWRLDEVVVTHPDSDHYNGLPFVVRRFRPQRLWINGEDRNTWPYGALLRAAAQAGTEIREPAAGDAVPTTGAAHLFFVNGGVNSEQGEGNRTGLGKNDRSLVLRLVHGKTAFLFPGDIQFRGEGLLLKGGADLRADVLLAAHHGSSGSSSAEFVAAADPRIIIVSSGRGSAGTYGDEGHLRTWREDGRTVLSTMEEGTITLTTDGERVSRR